MECDFSASLARTPDFSLLSSPERFKKGPEAFILKGRDAEVKFSNWRRGAHIYRRGLAFRLKQLEDAHCLESVDFTEPRGLVIDCGANYGDFSRAVLRKMPDARLALVEPVPWDAYKFAVITFEHDAYYAGNTIRDESRTLLKAFGYHLLIADVEVSPGNPFKDWYVHPELVGHDLREYAEERKWSRKLANRLFSASLPNAR